MSLASGARLGRNEIVSLVGTGGMVYRTTRCNLSAEGRTVYFESVTLDADVWLLELA